jgi:hypothetical protein
VGSQATVHPCSRASGASCRGWQVGCVGDAGPLAQIVGVSACWRMKPTTPTIPPAAPEPRRRGGHPLRCKPPKALSAQPRCLSPPQRHRAHVLPHEGLATHRKPVRPSRLKLPLSRRTRRNRLFLAPPIESATLLVSKPNQGIGPAPPSLAAGRLLGQPEDGSGRNVDRSDWD